MIKVYFMISENSGRILKPRGRFIILFKIYFCIEHADHSEN
jgi:hypothetical protein